MALEDIIEKIRSDASAGAEELLAGARAHVEERLAEARRLAEEAKARRLEQAERDAGSIRLRILALARLEARDHVLGCKQAGVESVFERAGAGLREMKPADYRALLEKVAAARASDGEDILPGKADAALIDESFVAGANKQLAERGAKLRLGPPAPDIERGFILKSGKIVTDCSLETLLREARERLETEVYRRLFGEEARP